jgi:hypothetical protein
MKKLTLIAVLFAAACGDPVFAPTQQEAARAIYAPFCEAYHVRCGDDGAAEAERCLRHQVHHFCELDDTCDDAFDMDKEPALLQCGLDIETEACEVIRRYDLPESCAGLVLL